MNNLQWYDWLRLVICLLALVSMFRLATRARRLWQHYTSYLKDLWWVLMCFLALTVEASIEEVVTNAGRGPRTLLLCLVILVAFRATSRSNPKYLQEE